MPDETPAPDLFATATKVAERSEGAIPATHPGLDAALAAATTTIRNACHWHIFPARTVESFRPRIVRPGHRVWLPTRHLQEVTALTDAGLDVDLDRVESDAEGWFEAPIVSSSLRVSFVHGFEEVPADLESLTMELATGELSSSHGIAREQTLASSITWARTSGALTAADMPRLAAYRLDPAP